MPTVEKKTKAVKRRKRVAEAYEEWLKEHPKARRSERIKQFDAISDSAFLSDQMKING